LRSAKNYDFVDAVGPTNVDLTMADIRGHSAVLAELASVVLAELATARTVTIAGAMYDNLETEVVNFIG
jgi:hypothetical protein